LDFRAGLGYILALKDLGLSLEQIARLLDDDLPPAQIRGMLRMKQAEIQQHVEEEQVRLARVEARLRQIEQAWLETKNQEEGMSMRTCPECGKVVREPTAQFCPYCGVGLSTSPATLLLVQKPTRQLAKRFIMLLLLAIGLVIVISGLVHVVQSGREVAPSFMSGPISESRPPDAQLALLSMRSERPLWGRHFVFEGEVENISGSSLEDVVVVVSVYDDDPSLITSDEAPIEYATLLPGQTSPFKVMIDYNPEVEYYKVTFKHLLGDTIPTRDDRAD